jgi:polysaccharide biosynthesis transport protein
MEIKISDYLAPIVKWWWLILISAGIATAASIVIVAARPEVYYTRATVAVGSAINDPNPSYNELDLPSRLVSAYASIAKRGGVKNATMEALGLPELPEYEVYAVPGSPFIEIAVTDTDPERAMVVANELVHQLIQQSPTSSGQMSTERLSFLEQQLDELQQDIVDTQAEIEKKQEDLLGLTSAVQISDTQADIAALESKLGVLQANYSALLDNTQSGAVNTLNIVESAELPTHPIGLSNTIIVAITAFAGLVLGAGAAYALEYLDDTLTTTAEVQKVVNRPVIGYIPKIDDKNHTLDYVSEYPRSPVTDAFRSLRINVEFSTLDSPLKTIVVTSASESEGKTTIASNLAVSLAQGGKKVVLLEADLRRPKLHTPLGISEDSGLSQVFLNGINVNEVMHPWVDENLNVVVGGFTPPNTTELLGSARMDRVLNEIEKRADIVIIDAPPFFVPDALVLASKVDGVLLVVSSGSSKEKDVRGMMEQIDRTGVKVIGVAMNKVTQEKPAYYG